jgi:hypothetical protein
MLFVTTLISLVYAAGGRIFPFSGIRSLTISLFVDYFMHLVALVD